MARVVPSTCFLALAACLDSLPSGAQTQVIETHSQSEGMTDRRATVVSSAMAGSVSVGISNPQHKECRLSIGSSRTWSQSIFVFAIRRKPVCWPSFSERIGSILRMAT